MIRKEWRPIQWIKDDTCRHVKILQLYLISGDKNDIFPCVHSEDSLFEPLNAVAVTFIIFQVGNKADLTDRREVEFEVAAEFARQNNITYIETSVMRKSNIKVSLLN